MDFVTEELFQYAIAVYRTLHRHPEVGFDLPNTVAFVSGELDKMGIEHTNHYGTCSVVGFIGSDPAKPTLGIRADMDALPVQEKTDLPYSSEIDGKMHACGHDAHTACLLATAQILKSHESMLSCNVRLIFQPSEEGEISGAKMMVDNGVMEGVDAIIAQHNENTLDIDTIAVHGGDCMAACIPANLRFFGKTAHATMAETGIDTIAMGIESYDRLKAMVSEEAEGRRYVWSVGTFHAGTVHNVIADLSEQKISFRYFDQDFANRVMLRAEGICADIATTFGGRSELDWHVSARAVINDDKLADFVRSVVSETTSVQLGVVSMASEDFSWYLSKAPGVFYRFGTKNEALHPVTRPHNNDYVIDPEGMRAGIRGLTAIALRFGKENMLS
jgi:amidohydrolase